MLKVDIYATSSRENTFRKLEEKLLKRKEKEKEKKWCLKIRTVDVYRYGRWESVATTTSYLKDSTSKVLKSFFFFTKNEKNCDLSLKNI